MKRFSLLSKLLVTAVLLTTSVSVFAERTLIEIIIIKTTGGDLPDIRFAEPVDCASNIDAGYTKVEFRQNLGVATVTVFDSSGRVVDEMTVNTAVEKVAILNLPDPDDTYSIQIDGKSILAEGFID